MIDPNNNIVTAGLGWTILHLYAKYIDPNEKREYRCKPHGYEIRIGAFVRMDKAEIADAINQGVSYNGANLLGANAYEIREMARQLKARLEID